MGRRLIFSACIRRGVWSPLGRIALMLACLSLTAVAPVQTDAPRVAGGVPSTYGAASALTPPVCDGPRDLVVDGGKTTITGTRTFDRVCVVDGGVLRASGVLRVGVLYVAPTGYVSADGVPGGGMPDECGDQSSIESDGASGASLHILAQEAIVRGPISADGGGGLNGFGCGEPDGGGGRGGRGGHLTLDVSNLLLAGPLYARGGDGGLGYYGSGTPGHSSDPAVASPGGDGGDGGDVTLRTGRLMPSRVSAYVSVSGGSGGQAGVRGRYPAGKAGGAGRTSIMALTRAQQALLPHLPPPVVSAIGIAPLRLPSQPLGVFERGMRCGGGDLRVTAGRAITLRGFHRYRHVCVYKGGILQAGPRFTLQAQTILVERGGNIVADGTVESTNGRRQDGRYESAGLCAATVAPHSGVPGAPSDSTLASGAPSSDAPVTPSPGNGGGSVTLQGARILIAGMLSADGGNGGGGQVAMAYIHGYLGPWAGAGGGFGGGIFVVAKEVQLQGSMSVVGGSGGQGGIYVVNGRRATQDTMDADTGFSAENGPHGGPGCIKLLTSVLRASTSSLPVVGPTLIGRP